MIERRVHPVRGVVALVTSLREIRSNVIRVGRSLVVLQMARDAGRAVQSVIVVNVAIGASPRRNGMKSGQRETGAVMIERRIRPVNGAVALLAGLREVRGRVVGTSCSLEILQVARHACGAVQSVVIVDVAISALARRRRVHSC